MISAEVVFWVSNRRCVYLRICECNANCVRNKIIEYYLSILFEQAKRKSVRFYLGVTKRSTINFYFYTSYLYKLVFFFFLHFNSLLTSWKNFQVNIAWNSCKSRQNADNESCIFFHSHSYNDNWKKPTICKVTGDFQNIMFQM